jgi:hypothetical protein
MVHRTLLLAVAVALASQDVSAREIRRDAVPDTFWGTWAPGNEACNDKDRDKRKPAVVLSANSYAGPAGSCVIDYVTEIPGRDHPIFSARMHCMDKGGAQAKAVANLIIRPDASDQISAGATFESLVAYRRCPAQARRQP